MCYSGSGTAFRLPPHNTRACLDQAREPHHHKANCAVVLGLVRITLRVCGRSDHRHLCNSPLVQAHERHGTGDPPSAIPTHAHGTPTVSSGPRHDRGGMVVAVPYVLTGIWDS
jgi:hypothetical protein